MGTDEPNHFDAIVVGTGITGGWAAKELCERGLETLVLERGRDVRHAAPNVFVTDGACMTSSACQNPSFTYMALTARAAAHAVSELRRGQL